MTQEHSKLVKNNGLLAIKAQVDSKKYLSIGSIVFSNYYQSEAHPQRMVPHIDRGATYLDLKITYFLFSISSQTLRKTLRRSID